ncbi:MAG: two-component system, chemotaxis family, CheB/CheR fusion protein, partial [Solirubrobacteraceae bacterium]|nr:two-component system, chemotaxis family, CheB/CheR fusion protein [Solirubrobacteraceae bacterium]
MSTTADTSLDTLLEFLKFNRGFDFTGYKRSSIERRIGKRMDEVGVSTHVDYIDHLELHPEEFEALFNTILINVTAFFRDPDTWKHLRTDVLPGLVETLGDAAPIRIWCAGCASGEEAYTIAMVMAELLGDEAYVQRVKIYATDVDEEALDHARAAGYDAKAVEAVPEDLRAQYFEADGDGFRFRGHLRRTVIFGRNDLVQDAPISRANVLLCRNTLMYFNSETQAKIVRRFHFGLDAGGVLVLGRSEMLVNHSDLFAPIDLRRRLFRKLPRPARRERLGAAAGDGRPADLSERASLLREQAFDRGVGAHIVIDADGALVAANLEARGLFSIPEHDLGRPMKELEVSYRPVELRAHLEHVAADRRPVRLNDVPIARDGVEGFFQIRLTPLIGPADEYLGTAVTFVDVTTHNLLQAEVDRSKLALEQAYEELHATVEELETTNEELQSTNEELETTNEELQSTNEQLETMNEELQSTNEQLETMNDELRERSGEITRLNTFLGTILSSMSLGVAVVDRKGVIQVWNTHAADLWGLRSDEVVGQSLLGLDIGLPVEQLAPGLRAILAS